MKRFNKLRLSKAIEIVGLDIAEMGGLSEGHYKQLEIAFGHHMKNPRFGPSMVNSTQQYSALAMDN